MAMLVLTSCADDDSSVPRPDTTWMERRVAQLIRETRRAVLEQLESAEAWWAFAAACDAHKMYEPAVVA